MSATAAPRMEDENGTISSAGIARQLIAALTSFPLASPNAVSAPGVTEKEDDKTDFRDDKSGSVEEMLKEVCVVVERFRTGQQQEIPREMPYHESYK